MHQIYGIRHHGPGSAKRLKKALNNYRPDVLLVEAPPDAEKVVKYIADKGLQPPVAILVYNPKDLQQAAYFPFAAFSPEWVALTWALENQIPIEFMDLPQAIHFALDADGETISGEQLVLGFDEATAEPEPENEDTAQMERDPIGYLGRLAGYEDGERWWEVTFEANENEADVFPAVTEMLAALRAEIKSPMRPREALREAYMRQTLRKAVKNYEKVAVVCGAFHAPVLRDYEQFKASADAALLKGLKKIKTEATWIPWTYQRLSYASGYGAGVLSPAWYAMLFSPQKDTVIRWMINVAKLLRKEDIEASSASVIEAVRLADTLAALRGLALAGISELDEAAKTVFCKGYDEPMSLIRERLIIGDTMGKVPKSVPVVPLQADLEKQVKTARLVKEYESAEVSIKELDLRKDTHTAASLLLHRLRVLNIDWGKLEAVKGRKEGSFHENWRLRWKVGFPLAIIEAGMWGNSVETAANNFVKKKANEAETLAALSELLDAAIDADLKIALPYLAKLVQDKSAVSKNVLDLMQTLPILVKKIRYGTVRQIDLSNLLLIVQQILPRIFIGLPTAVQHIDETAAAEIFKLLQSTNRAISLLNDTDFQKDWHKTLLQIATLPNTHGIIAGGVTRILSDKGVIDLTETGRRMEFALSSGNDSAKAANWLEGFLYGSGLLLIYNATLWNILNNWVEELNTQSFNDILPLLRRTFSAFDVPERQKMLVLAQKGNIETAQQTDEQQFNQERVQMVLPKLRALLGSR